MQRRVSIAFDGFDSETPPNELLCAKYTKSFAYYTVKDRLPVILTKVINDLVTTKKKILQQYGEDAEEDLKSVIGNISKLKNEVLTNKLFLKLSSVSEDAEEWNNYLESQINSDYPPCWYYSPFLYVDNYLYRRLWEIFETSKTLQQLDPYSNQKENYFHGALAEIEAIGKSTLEIVAQIKPSESDLKDKFCEFLKLSLWSNRCDLTLVNVAQLREEGHHFSNVNALDSMILCDDSYKVYEFLEKNPNKVIDFVNDNSSFEVFNDFCFCDFLCVSSLASQIRFHVKKFPWFVSDTMKKDINFLLEKLDKEGLKELSDRWRKYFENGMWSVLDEKYWTLPFDYQSMKENDSALYNLLSSSGLVIFKGDLNYRKLLGDINWNHDVKFELALRDFKPTNILTLRTVKCDIICGLKPEKAKELSKNDKMWMRNGEYAVIQFYLHS